MKPLDLLKGKKIMVMTDVKVPVEMEIKEIKEEHHSEDIGESNAGNDWWPEQRTWTTYKVIFTNGVSKSFSNLNDIEII